MSIDMRRVGWVVSGAHPEAIASYRYSALIPAAELGSVVLGCEPDTNVEALLDEHRPSALVLGKAFHEGFVRLATAARARRLPVLAAMCDWLFEKSVDLALARIADRIIVQTNTMADEVRRHFDVEPSIIEEPYEGPRGKPRFSPRDPLRLVWFGHSSNLDTLSHCIAELGSLPLRFHLTIVTNELRLAPQVIATAQQGRALISVEVAQWSLATQWAKLAESDIVLLPSHPGKEKLVKGHNRLVQAIHSGRFALAYPLPQYSELSDFCWCGDDFAAGLQWSLQNPAEAVKRIRKGQRLIDERFSPARIARRWREEIEKASAGLVPGA